MRFKTGFEISRPIVGRAESGINWPKIPEKSGFRDTERGNVGTTVFDR